MAEFAKRFEAAVSNLKGKIGQPGKARSGDVPPNATEDLRRAAAELEADLSRVLEQSTRATARAGECETRAMEAIRKGDDDSARLALREYQECLDTIQKSDVDAGVLRTMLAECAAVLDEAGQQVVASALGELIVGIDDAPPVPLQEGSPESGNFRGYEVDILNDIAQRIGMRLRYRRALWSTIVPELEHGTIDVICSAATVTSERAAIVDFCTPHLQLTLAVVTRAGDDAGTTLTGRRVGARAGTTAEAYARSHDASEALLLSESNEDLYSALAAGSIDVVIDDSPIAAHFARAVAGLQFAGRLPGTEAAYAIMVRKGNTVLRSALNGALASMEADGTLDALREHWRVAAT